MFDRLVKKAEQLQAQTRRTLKRSAGSDAEMVPVVMANVRRFQGRFECGCEWPVDVPAPEECAKHPGSERVYRLEQTLAVNTTVMQA